MFSLPLAAQDAAENRGGAGNDALDAMYAQLRTAPEDEARRLGKEIRHILSQSGSPTMNLLLKRGRSALERGDTQRAIQHLTALTDHAPEFAEGWHARSVAYARAGLIGPALGDLERALTLDPRNFAALFSLAALLEQIDQLDLAQEAYNRVLTIHPYFEDVTTALERLNAQLGGTDI
ncbi:tetratricopeptide repeat protein [Roseovarius aestuarii]|nr:tetratricopeptide repeat protein [Roseovarius aestuarii]